VTDPSPGNLVILTMGRVSVDFYAEQVGVTLAQVRTFRKVWGAKVKSAGLGRTFALIQREVERLAPRACAILL
jgi:hypothetical protein